MRKAGHIWAGITYYARLVDRLAAWPALLVWWGRDIQVFCINMAHRAAQGSPRAPDLPCTMPDCDFSVFWPAGRMARAGHAAAAYDPSALLALRRHDFYPALAPGNWYYPPVSLLPILPVSGLAFEPAFWLWSAALMLAAITLLRLARLPWSVVLLGLASPAALWCLELGQFGILSGAALVAGLVLVPARPVLAGLVLALLALKPQPGLAVPAGLLSGRAWRVILAGAALAMMLILASLLILGGATWRAYVLTGLKISHVTLAAPVAQGAGYIQFGVSVFWMLRSFGAGTGLADAAQALAALAALALTWRVWRVRQISSALRVALTVFLGLLVTPYGFVDDMVAWSIVLALLARARGWRFGFLDVVFWLWPALCPLVFSATSWLLTPVVVVLALARYWPKPPPGAAVPP